jgi:hypothetical protein
VPVAFGPRHERAPAAAGLLAVGAARTARNAAELAAILAEWLTDSGAKNDAARQAIGYIVSHRGSAGRTAVLLDALM